MGAIAVKPKCPKCGATGPALEWRDLYLHTGEHLEEVFCLLCSVCYRAERDAEKALEVAHEVSVAPVPVEVVAVESAPVADRQPEVSGDVADAVTDFAAAADKYARIVAMAAEIGRLVVEKQQAYGDSFGRAGDVLRILYPEGIALDKLDDALAVIRVIDKLFRIATDRDALGEDPWKDVAGYGLLGTVRREV